LKRDWYQAVIALMWLVLPINAWSYWQAWEQLPTRMAVHFDANWQPNGYTSREGALMLGLGVMAVTLLLFTVAGLIARAMKPVAAVPMLIVFYVVLGFLWYGNHSIVEFNLKSRPARSELVGPISPAVSDSEAQFLS